MAGYIEALRRRGNEASGVVGETMLAPKTGGMAHERVKNPLAGRGAGDVAAGLAEALLPTEAWEVPLYALGPGGKTLTKAALGASAALAAGDAEAASPIQNRVFDILRKHKGWNAGSRAGVEALYASLQGADRSNVSSIAKYIDANPLLVARELRNRGVEVSGTPNALRAARPDEAFRVGDVAVPVAGDTTRAGVAVTRAGTKLKEAVPQYGGPSYSVNNAAGAMWASGREAAQAKTNNFVKAADEVRGSGEVKGVHVAMGPEGSFYAQHPTDLYIEQLRSVRPDKDARMAFADDAKRWLAANSPSGQGADAWGAYTDPLSPRMVELLRTNPEARKATMFTGAKPGWIKQGFPDMDVTMEAALEPRFHGQPSGVSGGLVYTPDLSITRIDEGETFNPTYNAPMKGSNPLTLDRLMPPEVMWPDIVAQKGDNIARSLQTRHWAQPITEEWMENAMRWWDRQQGGL